MLLYVYMPEWHAIGRRRYITYIRWDSLLSPFERFHFDYIIIIICCCWFIFIFGVLDTWRRIRDIDISLATRPRIVHLIFFFYLKWIRVARHLDKVLITERKGKQRQCTAWKKINKMLNLFFPFFYLWKTDGRQFYYHWIGMQMKKKNRCRESGKKKK